jgi:hypothetical protein
MSGSFFKVERDRKSHPVAARAEAKALAVRLGLTATPALLDTLNEALMLAYWQGLQDNG